MLRCQQHATLFLRCWKDTFCEHLKASSIVALAIDITLSLEPPVAQWSPSEIIWHPWIPYFRLQVVEKTPQLVGGMFLPLWKVWVRQLGWWTSQLNGKIKVIFQSPPTRQKIPHPTGRIWTKLQSIHDDNSGNAGGLGCRMMFALSWDLSTKLCQKQKTQVLLMPSTIFESQHISLFS